MRPITLTALLAAFAAHASASATTFKPPTEVVPLIGPAFLANFDPTGSHAIDNATEAFPSIIASLFDSGALNKTDLVFSVDVFSAATNASLYSYHHVGEGQERVLTTGKVDDQTIGRTGSVTKLFTVYALLVKAGIGVFDKPVTDYLPELRRASASSSSSSYVDKGGELLDRIRWEEITIGALASHQAGSGGVGALLLEHVGEEEPITPEDLLTHMRDIKHPVTSPYRNAVYSDGGFALLGEVLARISGQSYGDAIQDILCKPLGMHHVSVTAPKGDGVNAVNRTVLSDSSSFGLDVPVVAGSGGIFANLADLRTLGLSILNSELLPAAATQQWMKPKSSTGSLAELVGAPWEIHRLAIPLGAAASAASRVSDLYTKAGGSGDYACILALSPDHGLGFSLLVAGSMASDARWPLRDAVGELFVPAAEAAAAANAAANLAGTFVVAAATDGQAGTNLTLSVDVEGGRLPGLGLRSLYINGTESRARLFLGGGDGGGSDADEALSTSDEDPLAAAAAFRLYPVGLSSDSTSLASLYQPVPSGGGGGGKKRLSHRLVVTRAPFAARAASEGGPGALFDGQPYWMTIDFDSNLDDFVLVLGEGGRAIGVEARGLGMVFERE